MQGKVVAVTGANRGIGRGVAEALAKSGATVALFARTMDAAAKAASEIGENAKPFVLDVTNSDSVEAGFKDVIAAFGKIDGLVNNAGITRDNLAMRMKESDWREVIDANLTGTFLCTKAVLRHMVKARTGSVVNITSVVGQSGNPGQSNYCASKAGIEGFTRSLALEYAERGVRFNCVAPGFIVTDMTEVLPEEQKKALMGRIPMARLGNVNDVAEAVLFLSSDRSSYITGQVLHVNGGIYLG